MTAPADTRAGNRMGSATKQRLRTAADQAKRDYPGPVGDLLSQELLSWMAFGHLLGSALIMRVADLLVGEAHRRAHGPGPPHPPPPAHARMDRAATHAALRAAHYGARAHPGPVGELIERELHAYVQAGVQLVRPALAPRLIAVLTAAEDGEADVEGDRRRCGESRAAHDPQPGAGPGQGFIRRG